jgi:predicted enzyme related to lactoylglutathione lyase
MTIQRAVQVIAVPDLETSAAFYRDVLGFTIEEMGDPGWRRFVSGACQIMAGECPDAMPVADTGDHSYMLYLVVDEVDPLHARVVGSGAEIVKAPRDEPWGMREFGLRTVDGHRLMIGQSLG